MYLIDRVAKCSCYEKKQWKNEDEKSFEGVEDYK